MSGQWKQIAGMVVGSIIGVTIGHSVIRSLIGTNHSRQQAQQGTQNRNQPYVDNQKRDPLDSLKGQRFS